MEPLYTIAKTRSSAMQKRREKQSVPETLRTESCLCSSQPLRRMKYTRLPPGSKGDRPRFFILSTIIGNLRPFCRLTERSTSCFIAPLQKSWSRHAMHLGRVNHICLVLERSGAVREHRNCLPKRVSLTANRAAPEPTVQSPSKRRSN